VEQIAEVLRRCGTFQWVESGRGVPMGYYCRCGQRIGGSGLAAPRASWRTHQAEQVAALGVGDGEVECTRHAFPNDPDDPQTCIRCGATAKEPDMKAGVEWGVEEDDGDWTIFAESLDPNARQNAKDWAAGQPVMRRTVGPWVEVTDEGGEG
jgi:hypothetical protein